VWSSKRDATAAEIAYPDTLVGTDSHTTMVNGLGVLGWGVGGIEAEAAMLGQPVSMLIPEVVGFRLTGALAEGITATDLVLTVTQMLRKKGVVGRFVEFYGPGLSALTGRRPRDDRQHGARIWRDLRLLPDRRQDDRLSQASPAAPTSSVALVEAYAKAQGLWREPADPEPVFTDTLELDMATVEPSLAGPKRPQDKVPLTRVDEEFVANFTSEYGHKLAELEKRVRSPLRPRSRARTGRRRPRPWRRRHRRDHLVHQHLQPGVLIAAGLVAQEGAGEGA
jgi:aconitate hydratase